jgi:hypothetical protein
MDMRLLCYFALALILLLSATGDAAAQGYPGYPDTIMTSEHGGIYDRTANSKRSSQTSAVRRPPAHLNRQNTRRRITIARGSSGSVLPTPLPRTPLIPPERSGTATVHITPPEQSPTVVPGIANPVPNLPHGTESFQDRASRCAFQQGLYNVPGNMSTQYMGACVQ